MRDHTDDAANIQLASWRMRVRLRPDMYFGRQRTDLRLPGAVLWLAVADALSEQQAEPPLHVRVVIETERQFRIADNGPGLPVEPVAEGREPAVTEMLTCLFVGRLPRGWSFLGQITAVSSMVTADVWRQGRHYRQRTTWSGNLGPLEVLEPTQRHATRLVVRLDDDYFPPAAGLATDPAGLLASLLDDPGPFCSEPGFACGTR